MSENTSPDPAAMPNLLMEAMEMMAPILDAADGMRADLEKRGWSPTAAEQIALTWLTGALASVWRAGS